MSKDEELQLKEMAKMLTEMAYGLREVPEEHEALAAKRSLNPKLRKPISYLIGLYSRVSRFMVNNRANLVQDPDIWQLESEIEELQGVQAEAIQVKRTLEVYGILHRRQPDFRSCLRQCNRVIREAGFIIAGLRERQDQERPN